MDATVIFAAVLAASLVYMHIRRSPVIFTRDMKVIKILLLIVIILLAISTMILTAAAIDGKLSDVAMFLITI